MVAVNNRGNWNNLKPFGKQLSNIPGGGEYKIKELQKTAISATVHTLREVLMLKFETFSMGNNSYLDCNYRIAATPCS